MAAINEAEDEPERLPMPDRRRSHGRRDDDVEHDPKINQAWLTWVAWAITHRGKLATLAAGIASVLTFFATTMAMRIVGAQDLAELKRTSVAHDSAITSLDHRVTTVEENGRFQRYVSCVLLRRVDPNALPAECQTIIQSRSNP
jgi:hypothetical protein